MSRVECRFPCLTSCFYLPVIPISSHQDTVGPIARSVADAAAVLSIIAGQDGQDNYTSTAPAKVPNYINYLDVNAIKGKRFGVPRKIFTNDSVTGSHPSISVEFNKTLGIIRSLGGVVVDPADIPSAPNISKAAEMLVLTVDFKVRSLLFVSLISILDMRTTSG